MATLVKKIKITTTLTLKTGLHIGGTNVNIEIGGIDKSVIKNGFKKNQPYIPGSSLKGKLRCLLEQMRGASTVGGNSDINKLFGVLKKNSKEEKTAEEKPKEGCISKLIVRDAYINKKSLKELEDCDNLDMPYTEIKSETSIDRITGTAKKGSLRQIERIPAGVNFDAEFIINVWKENETQDLKQEEKKLINLLEEGLHALENDYLGGNGSRGYGQVKVSPLEFQYADDSTNWTMVDMPNEN